MQNGRVRPRLRGVILGLSICNETRGGQSKALKHKRCFGIKGFRVNNNGEPINHLKSKRLVQ